jgi:TPR repeat protein
MYYYGNGVPKDDTVAVRWGRKAADQGYAKAENGIAFMYYYGYGVPQDYAEVLRWYRKAADQGNASAQDDLGSIVLLRQGSTAGLCRGASLVSAGSGPRSGAS